MQAGDDGSQTLKKCPFCGKEIKKTAYRCSFCGQSLAELDQQQWEERLPPSVSEQSEEPEQASTVDDAGLNPFSTAIVIALVVILSVIISFWLFSPRKGELQDLPLPTREQSHAATGKRNRIQEPPKLAYPESGPMKDSPSFPEAKSGGGSSSPAEKIPEISEGPEPNVLLVGGQLNLSDLAPGQTMKSAIKAKLGQPDLEYGRLLDYNWKYGLEFHMAENGVLEEIRVNTNRFKGRLSSGVSFSSTKQDIFAAFGEPVDEVFGEDLLSEEDSFTSGIMYTNGDFSRISYRKAGITFWFNEDRIIQIGLGRKS